MHTVFLVATAFLASAVEMVEALTVVLAVGITRGWRSALLGVLLALAALGLVVGALGPSLVRWVPLTGLRVVVGTLLLIFGLQWLRKAVLRASSLKAKHDEDLAFAREREALAGAHGMAAVDWTGFVVAFKGVFLEGLEVAFIVLTFGANAGRFGPAITGAVSALVLVTVVGVLVHQPLSQVPENAIKFSVGIALTSFGTYWAGEGIGVDWSLGDLTLLLLALVYGGLAALLVAMLHRQGSTSGSLRSEGAHG